MAGRHGEIAWGDITISRSHSLGDQLVKRFNKDALPAPPLFGLRGVNDFDRLKDLGVPPLASPNLPWKD